MKAAAPGTMALPERVFTLGLALFIAFAVVSVGLYGSVLTAPFVSDDFGYIVSHPHTDRLDGESIREIFDPWGAAKLYTANYAPLHLLFTAAEREFFGESTLGYHIVNLLLHSLVAALLVVWLWQLGVGRMVAGFAGLFFLVHPANIEAVAWASQLKTLAAMLFSLLALLSLPRFPAVGLVFFMLGLLTKAAALFVIPTGAVLAWVIGGAEGRRMAGWLTACALLAAIWAVPHVASFAHVPAVGVPAFDDPMARLYTMGAIAMRYAAMALTTWGLSAWHEPLPVTDPLNAWLWGGLALGILGLVRLGHALRARSTEAVFWVAAAAAFVPVSQVVPFAIPMADRYLYFMLPGLIGGGILAAAALVRRFEVDAVRLAPLGVAFALALVFAFGWRTVERAPIWESEIRLLIDAALRYPDGSTAAFMRARRAAEDGDVLFAVEALRRATDRGLDRFMALPQDPGLAPIRDEPAFQALVRELAGRWIEQAQTRDLRTQPELRVLGLAHLQRAEYREAAAAFESALDAGGPLDTAIRAELHEARSQLGTTQARVFAAPGVSDS